MDSTCPGCGSMYNGNSQFCSRYCFNNNFDVDQIESNEMETPSKKRKSEETHISFFNTPCVGSFFDLSKKTTKCEECGRMYNERYEICSQDCSIKKIRKQYLEYKQKLAKKQRQGD